MKMAEKKNTRGIVVAKLTKDIEHLLTAARAQHQHPEQSERAQKKAFTQGRHYGRQIARAGDCLVGRSNKVYSRKKLAHFVAGKAQVIFKLSTYRKTAGDLKNHIDYVSRNGKVPLEDQNGNLISGKSERDAIAEHWHDIEITKAKARAKYLDRALDTFTYPRVAASIVLSMPAGTDRDKFSIAVREYCRETFADKGFEYLLAMHNDTIHPHAHLVLRLRNIENNRKLNPGKKDLKHWRERLQRKMTEHGLDVAATPSRLRGLTCSENRKTGHMDYRALREAMIRQGVKQEDVVALLKRQDKSRLEKEMNKMNLRSRRQENLKKSVAAALVNEKMLDSLQTFTTARREERKALLEAIGDVAKDIGAARYPEEAGMLMEYARRLPDPMPEAMKLITRLAQEKRYNEQQVTQEKGGR